MTMLKKYLGLVLCTAICAPMLLLAGGVPTVSAATPIKVACVGDSITAGSHSTDAGTKSYPVLLRGMLGADYTVNNYGVSGRTLLSNGDNPYITTTQYTQSKAWNPDIVIIMLGTNDSKTANFAKKDGLAADLTALVNAYRALESHPLVVVATPPAAFSLGDGIQPANVQAIADTVRATAATLKAPLIDINQITADKFALYDDGVHFGNEGYAWLAQWMAEGLKDVQAHNFLTGVTVTGMPATIDQAARTVRVDMPCGTTVETQTVATQSVNGATAVVSAAKDKITVTGPAGDGTDVAVEYALNITPAPAGASNDARITSFSIGGVAATVDHDTGYIFAFPRANEAAMMALAPSVAATAGALVKTEADYKRSYSYERVIEYTVTAPDGVTKKSYTVLVSPSPKIKVACCGDSITYGDGPSNQSNYVNLLQRILGDGFDVRNFGQNSLTVQRTGLKEDGASPVNATKAGYMDQPIYQQTLTFKPDVVFFMMGGNDSKDNTVANNPQHVTNWIAATSPAQFETDYRALITSFQNQPQKPLVIVPNGLPIFPGATWAANSANMNNIIIPLEKKIIAEMNLPTVDTYELFKDRVALFGDKLHPNANGHYLIAAADAAVLLAELEKRPVSITKIDLNTAPDWRGRVYVGDTLDPADGAINLWFSDGRAKTIPMTPAMLSGLDTSKPGEVPVTVSCFGYSFTFTIEVLAPVYNYTWGDVSGEGAVDSTDARMVLQHEVNLITLTGDALTVADVSADDKVDSTDARMILQHEVNLIDRFPAEGR